MDELLTPVTTKYLRQGQQQQGSSGSSPQEAFLVESTPAKPSAEAARPSKLDSAEDALSMLKSQPDYDSLAAVLRFLTSNGSSASSFNLHAPTPTNAAIVHLLATEIAPNYWTVLLEGYNDHGGDAAARRRPPDAERLLQCLRGVTGINALVSQIKALLNDSSMAKGDSRRPEPSLHLKIFLEILAAVLEHDDSIRLSWEASTCGASDPISKKVQSKSLLSIIASGRIPSICAEALAMLRDDEAAPRLPWLGDGKAFTKWIARNVVKWAKRKPEGDELQACRDLFQRSLSMGYPESLVTLVVDELLFSKGSPYEMFPKVCLYQSQPTKKVLGIFLEHLARAYLNAAAPEDASSNATISAAAGIIDVALASDEVAKDHLVGWCCSPSGAGLGNLVGIRRAVIAVLAQDAETITKLLDKSLAQFGDQLYIKHTAILQQEAHAQIVLLSAAYLVKRSPVKLTMLLRSGTYLTAISNRIASTHPRARFLGMAVGEALSALIDNKAKKLDFHMDETDTEEAQWLKSLTAVSDAVGPMEPLLSRKRPDAPAPPRTARARPKPKAGKPHAQAKPSVAEPAPRAIIEEIDSSSDEDDEQFSPMAKGSDAEDSDDDPTLIQRNKPKAPVYIRDLITYLRDSESYDKQKLGVQTAPVLIRRKGNYGTEVSSHAEELARQFVGLQDKFDIEGFDDLRLQGMLALIVAQPKSMAPWFSRTFFEGDYSLSQRTAVLVAIGLAARELAGIDTSQYQTASAFPSKRLPEKMERLYLDSSQDNPQSSGAQLKGLPPTALDNIAKSLTSSFLAPLAAEAADANTGPDALKLQTFTARYKTNKARNKPRVRAIPNTTAALLATYFFSPLTAHFQFALRSSKPVVLNPAMLALYLQTLGIIVNAAGPSTLSLPQLTAELWDLLLRVRTHVVGDVAALKGWLVAMAVLLEVNEDNMRTLCQDHGREVVETREWASSVFNTTRGDHEAGGDENDVKMLAAGVLIKLGEMIEKYQALLMGDMIGYN